MLFFSLHESYLMNTSYLSGSFFTSFIGEQGLMPPEGSRVWFGLEPYEIDFDFLKDSCQI